MQYIKLVVVGDGAIGKTSLFISYASGGFPRDYVPTVFDNFSSLYMYQGKPYNLGLFDTAGQEDFDRLRPLGYNDTDVFLVCYSVINPPSYSNVIDKWYVEITHYTQDVPIVLIGTQIDLRQDKSVLELLALKQQCPITYEEGMMMRKKIGAKAFTECSVLTQKGVKQVFEEAIRKVSENVSEAEVDLNKGEEDDANNEYKPIVNAQGVRIEPRYYIEFTCTYKPNETAEECGFISKKTFTKHSYHKGVVIIRCEGCQKLHLIADHLGYTGYDSGKTIEEIMEKLGKPIKKLRLERTDTKEETTNTNNNNNNNENK
eukprot:gene9750-11975_t